MAGAKQRKAARGARVKAVASRHAQPHKRRCAIRKKRGK